MFINPLNLRTMKQALALVFFVMLFGITCRKEVSSTSIVAEGNYAGKATVTPEVKIMVVKCDTTYVDDPSYIDSTTTDTATVPEPPVEPPPPPPEKTIVFFGSSTISQWNLEQSFPGYPVKKVGYGGKTWSQLIQLTDTIHKLNPKQVVVYSGDNDIIAQRSVGSMCVNIQRLCNTIWEADPEVVITFLYTKPSDTAFHILYRDGITTGINAIEYTNRNITNWAKQTHPLNFNVVDSYLPFLNWGPKRLNTKYYKDDFLHLNQTYGYDVLNRLLMPKLL